jgi:phenylpropionate dioxygenase-like ring-hydroxylating dioxygenase large terminal subunit
MDPAHGPYVHKSWFWRSEKTMLEKRKKFAPVNYGFQMVRHQPSKNSKAYKILGGAPTTEITFTLPCVRVENIEVGKRNFYSFTALTPVDENNTRVTQLAYWNIPWLSLLKPALHIFSKNFLGQDMDAVTKQQVGLKYDPSLMLIKDADTQAKWYYALKTEYHDHLEGKRPFNHPVKETELRWRS